jgi:hypothetical protein
MTEDDRQAAERLAKQEPPQQAGIVEQAILGTMVILIAIAVARLLP